MREALRNAFLDPNGSRQFAKQQVASIRMDRIERPAQFEAIEPLRLDPVAKQQVERCVGKKLGGRDSGR
jgi:hypothetical protein